MMRSLGVDVSERRGLDLVLLDADGRVLEARRAATLDGLCAFVTESKPDVIAVDSPPACARAEGGRLAERELARLGIRAYGVPHRPVDLDQPFLAWMRVGFQVFARCEALGYRRFRGDVTLQGCVAEVFPHASAVVLAHGLPAQGVTKRVFRRDVLDQHGLSSSALTSLDLVDAALAALTGMFALGGRSCWVGDPEEGVILLPTTERPTERFRRCRTPPPAAERQRHLPRLAACACGDPDCQAATDREFAPGHDAKRKSILWQRVRLGEEAMDELRRRGWELPPELR
jgi:predicted nuclease with RNAse H fold